MIKSKKKNDVSLKDFSISNNINNLNVYYSTNNLGMIKNNSENEDIKNLFPKEEFENQELKNQKLINKLLNEQYIKDKFAKEQYKFKNCNKYNKEKGINLCKLCINEILDSILLNKKFDIKNIKFKYEYFFDKLFNFSKHHPEIKKYIEYIKSKICVNCGKIMDKPYNNVML